MDFFSPSWRPFILPSTTSFSLGIGWSHQVLGRVALAEGFADKAAAHLAQALQSFDSIGALFEAGRVHLFAASLAHVQGDDDSIASHLNEARSIFTAVRAPKHAERCGHLAKDFTASLKTRPAPASST